MAILHHKEEKIQVVLGRLPKYYTHEQFVEMFIKLYSKDWGKIKSAYVKQSQDKEPGTIITMPKPELYLKQLVATYLTQNNTKVEEVKEAIVVKDIKGKTPGKKKTESTEDIVEVVKKPKPIAKKKVEVIADKGEVFKKPKTSVKKVLPTIEEATVKVDKKKEPAKKKVETEKVKEIEEIKPKTVKTTKK